MANWTGEPQEITVASTTYFVALLFIASDEGLMPAEAQKCQSENTAKMTALALSRNPKYVGAIAFQRTGDLDQGEFGDAAIIKRFGETPSDLSAF